MRVVTPKEFAEKHPQAKIPLLSWHQITRKADWQNLNEIKKDFSSVDYVGNNRFVFNIKGNDYRFISIIIFASQKLYIRFIGTHAEYDRIDATTI
ncbi:MAG: type II toxin-antitoxin system HigB family toxin [Bacteroidetes bacterium]|nr:type II toxin-antitoxin system HigB family toxin [Bacteroidota bacterium]